MALTLTLELQDRGLARTLRTIRRDSVGFALKNAADQTARVARLYFIREFSKEHDFRKHGAVAPARKSYWSKQANRLVKPAEFFNRPTAQDYFSRMLDGGPEYAKSAGGMLIPRKRFVVGRGKTRRLRKSSKYYRSMDRKELWKDVGDRDEYVGPFKQRVVNPRNRRPFARTVQFARRYLRRRAQQEMRREIRAAILRSLR